MTGTELMSRLFDLANRLARQEVAAAFSGIAEVKGTHSWSFLEHLTELPDEGRSQLLHSLIKRRFALEGFELHPASLSAAEELEVEHWLKHDNSMHGTRAVPFFALSVREEEFAAKRQTLTLASRAAIRVALRQALQTAAVPISIVKDAAREISWYTIVRRGLRVDGWVDLAKVSEQAASFVVVSNPELDCTLHAPTSLLGIMGIGETSWRFLEQGQETLCSTSTVRFFTSVCGALTE